MVARVLDWLIGRWQWPAATLFAGLLLLLLSPVWFAVAGPPLGVVFLQLPVYMLHQWEEHAGDRFRLYVNRTIGHGREALTPAATFWINSLGVWAVDLAALYLAAFVDVGLGLVAVYLPLVNSLGHIGPAVAKREYNPGLLTAVLLFLPLGVWGLALIPADDWVWHATGLGAAVAVHVAIVIHVVRRLKRLPAAEPRAD